MTKKPVEPDSVTLERIFPDFIPSLTTILLNNWDKCIFRADFPRGAGSTPPSCVVRLEAVAEATFHFAFTSTLQQMASSIIPCVVPKSLQSGNVADAQGREFHFDVVEYVEGELLEDAWPQLSPDNRRDVVSDIVIALAQLRNFRPSHSWIEKHLSNSRAPHSLSGTPPDAAIFGGPHTGFSNTGRAFLDTLMARWDLGRPTKQCIIQDSEDGSIVMIQPTIASVDPLKIATTDMEQWPCYAVFCHNDLTPRNIILKPYSVPSGTTSITKYRLAAIIDWEMAGFYPASYELTLQDTYLGGANRHISYYLMLKEKMREITPRNGPQVALARAVDTIFMARHHTLAGGYNIPAHIRERVIEHAKLSRDSDPYGVWRRDSDLSAAGYQKLEDDVVREMIAKRKAQ